MGVLLGQGEWRVRREGRRIFETSVGGGDGLMWLAVLFGGDERGGAQDRSEAP